jgi:hypothetical protein
VVHDLDVEAADRVSHKGAIVPRMILRPRTGCTIVFAASFDSGFVELINELVIYQTS